MALSQIGSSEIPQENNVESVMKVGDQGSEIIKWVYAGPMLSLAGTVTTHIQIDSDHKFQRYTIVENLEGSTAYSNPTSESDVIGIMETALHILNGQPIETNLTEGELTNIIQYGYEEMLKRQKNLSDEVIAPFVGYAKAIYDRSQIKNET